MQTEETLRIKRKELAKGDKRIQELDRLFIHLYEDHVAGKVSEDRFVMMSQNYEDEQLALKENMEQLRQDIEAQEQKNQDLELFIQKVKKYADLEELTAYAVHDLIKAIYIGAPDKSSGKRHQEIHIEYDNVGFIPLDRLMKQEMA